MDHKRFISWGIITLVLLSMAQLVLASMDQSQSGDEVQQMDDSERFATIWTNTDFSKRSINLSEIRSGGVGRDQIPPYYPEGYRYPSDVSFGLAGQAPHFTVQYTDIETTNEYLPDEQQVIAVEVDGEAHAYPLLLLNNHEIVNTEIRGMPIAITFCPLCNASIVYERVVDGREYHFGVSGLLRNSDMVMWDHETESWWQQFTGEAIVGEMTGAQLNFVPSLVVSWGEFKAQYSDAKVLANQRGYSTNAVSYTNYDQRGEAFLFDGEMDDRLFAMERVLGYHGQVGAIAYPLSTLAEVGVVNDRINNAPVVVFWQPGSVSLFTQDIETGSAGLFSATLSDETVLTFSYENTVITDDQTDSTWNIFGRATDGELAGTQLEPYFAYPHFWFAWAAFRPDTLIWEANMIADEAWADVE